MTSFVLEWNNLLLYFAVGGWNAAFSYINRPATTPSTSDLAAYRTGEMSSGWIDRIEIDWYTCVLKYVSGSSPSYCG